LTIAEAAKATGLSPYTLRYDEQMGLIAPEALPFASPHFDNPYSKVHP
jgi:DNA-binding transcriptional MerR regulator